MNLPMQLESSDIEMKVLFRNYLFFETTISPDAEKNSYISYV